MLLPESELLPEDLLPELDFAVLESDVLPSFFELVLEEGEELDFALVADALLLDALVLLLLSFDDELVLPEADPVPLLTSLFWFEPNPLMLLLLVVPPDDDALGVLDELSDEFEMSFEF